MIDRRGLAVLALAALLAPALPHAASAQDVKLDELAVPGPLGDVVIGSPEAKVTVIEYASITCPHCGHFHTAILPEFKKKYIDTGKVRFIPREFPLDPIATAGFMLARCAGTGAGNANDKFEGMLDLLYGRQRELTTSQRPVDALMNVARAGGFTQASFESCLQDKRTYEAVTAVKTRGSEKFGVDSTPTFFINGQRQRGALSLEEMDKVLEPLLKTAS